MQRKFTKINRKIFSNRRARTQYTSPGSAFDLCANVCLAIFRHKCWYYYRILTCKFFIFSKNRKVVTNREWCGTMQYYVNCRQTWAIENFFSHTLLNYVPKIVSFTYGSYCIRNMLAIMDLNNHLHRVSELTKSGLPYVDSHFSRKTKQWVAYEKKIKKEYDYIPG